jgi:hypothetical protein
MSEYRGVYPVVECVECDKPLVGNPANQRLGFVCAECRGKAASGTKPVAKKPCRPRKVASSVDEPMSEVIPAIPAGGEPNDEQLLDRLIDHMLNATDWSRVPRLIKRHLVEQILQPGATAENHIEIPLRGGVAGPM